MIGLFLDHQQEQQAKVMKIFEWYINFKLLWQTF